MRYVSLCIILLESEHFCIFGTVWRCTCRRLVTLAQCSGMTAKLHSEQNRSFSCDIAQLFLGCTAERQRTSLVRIQLGQHKSLHEFTVVIHSVLLDKLLIYNWMLIIWTVHFPCCGCKIQVAPCSAKLGVGVLVTQMHCSREAAALLFACLRCESN